VEYNSASSEQFQKIKPVQHCVRGQYPSGASSEKTARASSITELCSVHSIDEKHKRMLPVPGSWFPVDKENTVSLRDASTITERSCQYVLRAWKNLRKRQFDDHSRRPAPAAPGENMIKRQHFRKTKGTDTFF